MESLLNWATCRYLQLLTLHDNDLTGAIPAELGNLTNLQSLFISNNQFTARYRRNWGTSQIYMCCLSPATA